MIAWIKTQNDLPWTKTTNLSRIGNVDDREEDSDDPDPSPEG